jgi:hypothetical protein
MFVSLLSLSPAHAQYPGGGYPGGGYPGSGGSGGYPGGSGYPGSGWTVTDSAGPNGNPLVSTGQGYPLSGTPNQSAANLYPLDMTIAALAPPTYNVNNSYWLQAPSGGPCSYYPNPLDNPDLYLRAPIPAQTNFSLLAIANNFGAENAIYGSFNSGDLPLHTNQMYQNGGCEPINGPTSANKNGTYWQYWHWNGPAPAPPYLDLLMTTTVTSSASVNYESAKTNVGLTASASATDGAPFYESTSAVIDATGYHTFPFTPLPAVPTVIGHHLLRVPVVGGVAAASLSGIVNVKAENEVGYGSLEPYEGHGPQSYYTQTNGQTLATSSGSVSVGVNQDTREVTLTRNGARQVGMVPAQNGKVYGEWVDPDGTAHGDTTFSYWTVFTGGLSIGVADHANWETFTPAFKGAWPVWLSIWAYPNTYTNP